MVQVFHLNRRLVRTFQTKIIPALGFLGIIAFVFEIGHHLTQKCPEQDLVDVVYTWVNGSDPEFLDNLHLYVRSRDLGPTDASRARYDDKDELKFSLRSLERYAPWINHVYIVTNGQIPHWLNMDCEKVSIITHDQIFTDDFNLPTFSSPAIELHLHRIPGLSKRFIYFNDDVFLRADTYLEDFISQTRGFIVYLAWMLPPCMPYCSWLQVADGKCDLDCNNPRCQMDGGDCDHPDEIKHGDVVVNPDDYPQDEDEYYDELQQTNYPKIIEGLTITAGENGTKMAAAKRLNIRQVSADVDFFVRLHNERIMITDKIRRRKMMERRVSLIEKLRNVFSRDDVDVYRASLLHTNRVLNNHYGFSVRKVPSHAPLMIDKSIVEVMEKRFAREMAETVSNRARSPIDLQFALAYCYTLIHEKVDVDVEDIFDELDVDQSGFWTENEVHTVITKLYSLPLDVSATDHFHSILKNCSTSSISDMSPPIVHKRMVKHCYLLSAILKHIAGVRHKYKYELIKDADARFVHFKRLTSNVSDVINQLDEIRREERKFVCLNDDLDPHRRSENDLIKRLMYDLYTSLFPKPSKFELPLGYKNRFANVEEYTAMVTLHQYKFYTICFSVFLFLFLVFYNSCRRRMWQLVRAICFN